MTIEFLVIGQGLAGSLLSWELMRRGRRVLIIDPDKENASKIAGGLINPVTGMRFAKTPNVDKLLPFAVEFYRKLETHFGQNFYIDKSMLRIIGSQKELDSVNKRLLDHSYRRYLVHYVNPQAIETGWRMPFGAIEQHHTGFLRTAVILDRLKKYFLANDSYQKSEFQFNALLSDPRGVSWNGIQAKKIIFCEGHRVCQNPWFSWLPLQPVKGEILTLETDVSFPDKIINFGHWLLAENKNRFRFGATFDRERLDTEPTEIGKQCLLQSLSSVCPSLDGSKIIAHKANIRPGTPDKKPFIGSHPDHADKIIFNGFGAKGSLLIPWYSHHLAEHLINQTPLCPSVNIDRYHDTHFPGRNSP